MSVARHASKVNAVSKRLNATDLKIATLEFNEINYSIGKHWQAFLRPRQNIFPVRTSQPVNNINISQHYMLSRKTSETK